MPLITNDWSPAAIRENIRREIEAGRDPKQAAAIAYATARRAWQRLEPGQPLPPALRQDRKPTRLDRLTRAHTAAGSFAELVADPYTPTLRERRGGKLRQGLRDLANAYDDARREQGKAGAYRPDLTTSEIRTHVEKYLGARAKRALELARQSARGDRSARGVLYDLLADPAEHTITIADIEAAVQPEIAKAYLAEAKAAVRAKRATKKAAIAAVKKDLRALRRAKCHYCKASVGAGAARNRRGKLAHAECTPRADRAAR